MSILLAAIAQSPVQLSYGRATTRGFADPAVTTIQFDSDGLIYGLANGLDKWFTLAPTVGAGAGYEIYATRTAGSLPTGTMDTWLPLSASQSWVLTQTGVGAKTSTLLIKIRTTSGAVLAQANFDMTAEVLDGA